MTADIDREKLRELCERATPGPWRWWTSCSWRRLSSDARGNDRNGKPLDREGGVICPYVCRDGHPDLIIREEDADFIAAARTSLPALLDLTDAQAAKIAELEAKNAWLKEQHETAHGIAQKCFNQREAALVELQETKARIASLESERDQLRKQVEGQFIAGMRRAAEICKEQSQRFLERAGWIKDSEGNLHRLQITDCAQANAFVSKSNGAGIICAAILSAASALEQKEQG